MGMAIWGKWANNYDIAQLEAQALHQLSHTRHSYHAGSGVGGVMYTLEGTKQ